MIKTFNKTLMVGAIALASSGASALETYNAKTTAMGGVGVASGDFASGTVMNPALAAKYKSDDNFNINLNAGMRVSDKDQVIDAIDNFQVAYEQLDATANDPNITFDDLREDVGNLSLALSDLDSKTLDFGAGVSFSLSIPNRLAASALVVNNYTKLGVGLQIADSDTAVFDEFAGLDTSEMSETQAATAKANELVNLRAQLDGGLNSRAVIGGYAVSEVGLAFAREVGYGVSVGVTPKMQRMDVFTYSQGVESFDDTQFDQDQYMSNDTQVNYDVGVYRDFGAVQVGVSAVNLAGAEFELDHLGATVELDPTYTVGTSYENEWVKVAVDYELTKSQAFNMTTEQGVYEVFGESQFARAGVEFDLFDNAQLRFGYQMDLEENVDNVASVGIGISPFDVVNMDLAATYGENDTYGVAAQFGFQF